MRTAFRDLPMDLYIYLKGILLGFAIAAPVGPIGVLCIRRTLASGRLHGLVTGLGAASADAVYGSIAVLGLTVISHYLLDRQPLLQLIGGAFLCFLAWQTWHSEVADKPLFRPVAAGQLIGMYASTFGLTLTNPMTIFSFLGIFAGLGAVPGRAGAFVIVLGVFCGSALWWLLLSVCTGYFREKMDTKSLVLVNRLSAILIAAFGLSVFYQMLSTLF
ncbi:LysE family transporter [Sporolactobacillus sp. CPB3-1]|uniref:LysE family transporter n=1 Tax=Sporolactobacillus mangiferae TaxID=2940498 RepID=A0ABT0MCW1_9BACL|nr:LysE family transporter [Sporolactobacillus mangiferae]MCL1632697.1 LysE family transporter [Sporolactobacillus mangiferae]